MLIWMRDSAFGGVFKIFLMGMLSLAVVGLVLTDVGGFFTGTMSANTVVKGGGLKIGTVEFDRTVQRFVSAQGIGAQQAYQIGLVDNILKGEIQNRVFTQEARAMGLIVSDEDVTRQMSRLAEPLATDGRTKKEALQQILRGQGMGEAEFITGLRQEMGNSLLRGALAAPATLTSPMLAKTLARFDAEKRTAAIVVYPDSGITGIAPPTDEQLQKYYDANKMDFLIPETRAITIATLKSDMVKKNVSVKDEELRAEYDKNIASYTKPARRLIEQIVVTEEAAAQTALADMKAGKPVKNALTKEYDEASLLPETGPPAFAAEKGAVIGPIKSDLGFHVLKIKDILPEKITPFDDVKGTLRAELESIKLVDEMYAAGNAIEDRAAGGEAFETIIAEYGMTTEIVGPFRRNGNNTDGKDLFTAFGADREAIIQSAYDFNAGEIAPLVETADGQFHLIRVDQVVPDSYRTFADVKSDLQKRWTAEQQKAANKERVLAALEKLKGGAALADTAREDGLSPRTVSNVGRKDTPAAPMSPIIVGQIFATEKGDSFFSETPDGFIVGTVTDATIPPADQKLDAKELAALEDLTGRSLAQDIVTQYGNALGEGKKIRINKAALDQMYGAPPAEQQ